MAGWTGRCLHLQAPGKGRTSSGSCHGGVEGVTGSGGMPTSSSPLVAGWTPPWLLATGPIESALHEDCKRGRFERRRCSFVCTMRERWRDPLQDGFVMLRCCRTSTEMERHESQCHGILPWRARTAAPDGLEAEGRRSHTWWIAPNGQSARPGRCRKRRSASRTAREVAERAEEESNRDT